MTTESHQIGRWMIWAGWLLLLGMLTYFFNGMLSQQENPNQFVAGSVNPEGVKEIVLTRNRAGHYVSAGFINGHAVEFLLDTGASDVAIPVTVAKRLQLQGNVPIQYQTANGSVMGLMTQLDTISIGNIELNNIPGGINPGMKGQQILLGMTFLKHLEFTQRGNQLIIRQYPKVN